jgi:broad specificity phosphatase PhoE
MSMSLEDREKEQSTRQIVLHFIRHAEAKYSGRQDFEGELTDEGRRQSLQAAKRLFKELSQDSVLAIYSSPRLRAQQTAMLIKLELEKLGRIGDKRLFFHSPTKTFSRFDLTDKMTRGSLDLMEEGGDFVKTWLAHPGQIATGFNSFFKKFFKLAGRIDPVGPDLHVVMVTHSGPSEVFAAGLTKDGLTGSLDNCEEFKIELPVCGDPVLYYKNTRNEITPI